VCECVRYLFGDDASAKVRGLRQIHRDGKEGVCVCVYVRLYVQMCVCPAQTLSAVPSSQTWQTRCICECLYAYLSSTNSVGYAVLIGLARAIYIQCTYGIFGREFTK
jgi:hypothetical protein